MAQAAAETKIDLDELKRVGIIAQNQKDTYLIRLRTVGGDLPAAQLAAITAVAERYGRGEVHLTTRQAVEIPFVHVDDLGSARRELEENGIVLGVCGPRGRGIVACPGTAVCTSAIMETKQLAAELDSAYFREQAPHKFKIGVSGCPNSCSKPIENDIGIMGGVLPAWDREACISCGLCVTICPVNAIEHRDDDTYSLSEDACIHCGLCIKNCSSSAWSAKKKGYTLFLGGTLGKRPRLGTRAKSLIETKEELLGHVESAFRFYLKHGRKKERFGHTLDRIGLDKAHGEIFSREDITDKAMTGTRTPSGDHAFLDLLGVCCPMNFVRAKLAIEKIRPGERLEILLDDGEPIVNVSRSLKDEGHTVLKVEPENGHFRVLVEKRSV